MRIGKLEINWSKKKPEHRKVLSMPFAPAIRLQDATPNYLRDVMVYILERVEEGDDIVLTKDGKQTLVFLAGHVI